MTAGSALPAMEALAYDVRRLLEADRASFALPADAMLSHRVGPDRVYFEILNGSSETVGMLLAVLTDPAEIDDPASLSSRMASGHHDSPGRWAFGLAVARRLPVGDPSLCVKVMIWIPASDLAEVVSRLTARPGVGTLAPRARGRPGGPEPRVVRYRQFLRCGGAIHRHDLVVSSDESDLRRLPPSSTAVLRSIIPRREK